MSVLTKMASKESTAVATEDVFIKLEDDKIPDLPESGGESDCDEEDDFEQTVTGCANFEPESGSETESDDDIPLKKKRKLSIQSDRMQWQKQFNERKNIDFGATPGNCNRRIKSDATPIQCFNEFFSEEIFMFMVSMTNLNAVRRLDGKREWIPVTLREMKAFVGLLIGMGIIRISDIDDYWQTKCWLLNVTGFRAVIARDRFRDIQRFLHFCDEDLAPSQDDPQRDRIYKIRPLIDLVLPRFERAHILGKRLSIDESLIPFKGRIVFRQFIPNKRARFGIKVFVLADSNTGYVSRLRLYTGRSSRTTPETGLACQVVQQLIQPYMFLGYHLYLDNFYSSPGLFQWLYDHKVYACGTVRACQRDFPKELVVKKPSRTMRGKSDWLMSGPILAQSWVDNRVVYFLSTIHSPDYRPDYETPRTVMRKRKRGSSVPVEVNCPPLLKDYNAYMGGVDRNDQMRKYFSLQRKTKKWYRKVFLYILELAIHNTRVVAEKANGSKLQAKLFRVELALALIGNFRTKVERQFQSDQLRSVERLDTRYHHTPFVAETRKRCVVCYKKYQKGIIPSVWLVGKSKVTCEDCKTPLCLQQKRNCYSDWHKKKEYWR